MKTRALTLITLLVASQGFAFSPAPRKDSVPSDSSVAKTTIPLELISDAKKTCVYAPKARTEAEKKEVLLAGAQEFRAMNPKSEIKELCLGLTKPSDASLINTYVAGPSVEALEPGRVTWTDEKAQATTEINHGFEREDAADYISALSSALNGKACVRKPKSSKARCAPNYKLALEHVHKELRVREHPLDWLLAP